MTSSQSSVSNCAYCPSYEGSVTLGTVYRCKTCKTVWIHNSVHWRKAGVFEIERLIKRGRLT